MGRFLFMVRPSIPGDGNRHTLLGGVSSADLVTPVSVAVDPTTHRALVNTVTGFLPSSYDYIAYTNTSSTVDTYVFKAGGSGGTTVATITITYTDTTKNQISTVART